MVLGRSATFLATTNLGSVLQRCCASDSGESRPDPQRDDESKHCSSLLSAASAAVSVRHLREWACAKLVRLVRPCTAWQGSCAQPRAALRGNVFGHLFFERAHKLIMKQRPRVMHLSRLATLGECLMPSRALAAGSLLDCHIVARLTLLTSTSARTEQGSRTSAN